MHVNLPDSLLRSKRILNSFALVRTLAGSAWAPTPALQRTGYVSKPINGHGGRNITIVPPAAVDPATLPPVAPSVVAVAATPDAAAALSLNASTIPLDFTMVCQELCALPTYLNGVQHVQTNTFCVGGEYGGAVLRVAIGASPIINMDSPIFALRVVDDGSTDLAVQGGLRKVRGANTTASPSPLLAPSPSPSAPVVRARPLSLVAMATPAAEEAAEHGMPVHLDVDAQDSRAGKLAPFGAILGSLCCF